MLIPGPSVAGRGSEGKRSYRGPFWTATTRVMWRASRTWGIARRWRDIMGQGHDFMYLKDERLCHEYNGKLVIEAIRQFNDRYGRTSDRGGGFE